MRPNEPLLSPATSSEPRACYMCLQRACQCGYYWRGWHVTFYQGSWVVASLDSHPKQFHGKTSTLDAAKEYIKKQGPRVVYCQD